VDYKILIKPSASKDLDQLRAGDYVEKKKMVKKAPLLTSPPSVSARRRASTERGEES